MSVRILVGDARAKLAEIPDGSIHCCITSPPYFGLRDYGTAEWDGGDPLCDHSGVRRGHGEDEKQRTSAGTSRDPVARDCRKCGATRIDAQIGLEPTLSAYIATLVGVFREVRRVLRDDGTVWLNLGDSFASTGGVHTSGSYDGEVGRHMNGVKRERPGFKPKDLMMVPARVAIALCDDGWYLRSAITWCKGSPMPESVQDRPSSATEMIYLFSKSPTYFYDIEATRVLANSLNRGYGVEEVGLKGGWSSPLCLPAQRRHVSLNDEWSPYLILAALFATERVLVQQRHDLLGKLFDALHLPANRRADAAPLRHPVNDAAKVAVDVLNHVRVVIAERDLQSEAELWVRLASGPDAVEGDDTALPVEQAREVMAKVIANAQLIRNAVPCDALTEGLIDIDAIHQAVPFFQAADAGTNDLGNGLVAESLLEQLDLTMSNGGVDDGLAGVRHNTLPLGEYQSHYTPQTPSSGRNLWNWWVVNAASFPGAHFATFPSKLIEPMILAGTSEKGCCGGCGAPWVRVVERESNWDERKMNGAGYGINLARPNRQNKSPSGVHAPGMNHDLGGGPVRMVGWSPSCPCPAAEPVPCTVLDPFGGAGTVGVEADRLGRDAVLIELNPEYAKMSEERIRGKAPMFARVEVG